MKDEFTELEAYMRYFIDNLTKNTKLYLVEMYSSKWKLGWSNPDEVIKQLKWTSCKYKHLSFEKFKQWNRRHLYE